MSLGQRLKQQIHIEWSNQTDDQMAFLEEIFICKELGEILKTEEFDFTYNPNTQSVLLNGEEYNDEQYNYDLPITVKDMETLIEFDYK